MGPKGSGGGIGGTYTVCKQTKRGNVFQLSITTALVCSTITSFASLLYYPLPVCLPPVPPKGVQGCVSVQGVLMQYRGSAFGKPPHYFLILTYCFKRYRKKCKRAVNRMVRCHILPSLLPFCTNTTTPKGSA